MDIDELLEEARSRATNYGKLYGHKETADDYLKLKYAELYDQAPEGTVPAIDAWIRRQPGYKMALERKMEAYADFKAAETYLKLLFVQAEVWRTKCANDRNMDRAHR